MLKIITQRINSRNHLRGCTWYKYTVICWRIKEKPLHRNFPSTIGPVCITDSNTLAQEHSGAQSWARNFTETLQHCTSCGLAALRALGTARTEHTGTDPHQHLPCLYHWHFHGHVSQLSMEWFRLGGIPGGYQTLAQGRVNLKVRSCFFNKLFSWRFREGLTSKQIISHFFSNRLVLIPKSTQYWSPRCNQWQMMDNKANTLTLDLTYATRTKNGVKQIWEQCTYALSNPSDLSTINRHVQLAHKRV